jgi:cellulose synthase (UDP-forming)
VAFESPLKNGRSVVALTGDNDEQISEVVASLSSSKLLPNIHGDLVLQSGKRAEGFQTGPTYYVGNLPWWTSLSWFLSRQPLVMIVMMGFAALLVSVVSFRYLRKLSAQRLGK